MERIVKYFDNIYPNDTAIEYVKTGLYSMLNCSYTSEDPDYGTDTIHYVVNACVPMEKIAYDLLNEISTFLDCREDRSDEIIKTQNDYTQYGNTTLYSIEHSLMTITKEYIPRLYATIREASYIVARALSDDVDAVFSFTESDREEAKENPEEHKSDGGWYGIRRINRLFDSDYHEFLVAAGYWGGGDIGIGYENTARNRADAVCKAITMATGWDADNYIYIEKEPKEVK